jgi:hypothetical protein
MSTGNILSDNLFYILQSMLTPLSGGVILNSILCKLSVINGFISGRYGMKKYYLILLSLVLICTFFLPSCVPVSCSIPGVNQPPMAYIDSIEPSPANEGQTVNFEGHGTDANGSIVAYRWSSSIDGDLSTKATFDKSTLSAGDHVIYFKVQDNNGNWSLEDRRDLTINGSATTGPTPGIPVINTFVSSPPSISAGASSTISWEVTGATSVSIDPGIGNVSNSGNRVVTPSATTTYNLVASNSSGSTYATCQVVVSGSAPPASYPIINYFTATSTSVTPGEVVTLSWSVSNASSVNIDNGVGTVAATGSISLTPIATTNFTLTAINSAGSTSQTITLYVSGAPSYGVNRVLCTGVPASGTYPCPFDCVFTFEIKTDGPCVVSYYVERSDGVIGPTKSMLFNAMDTKFLTSTWTVSSSGTYWERLHITSPNVLAVTSSPVTITCEAAFAVTSVLNTGATASGSRPCPATLNFIFSITTNGAGPVSYHVEQSDGAVGPTKTMMFTSAGTKSLTGSWTVSSSGSYWMKLVISAPNSTYKKSVTVNVTCE